MLSRDGGLGGRSGATCFFLSAKIKKIFINFFFFSIRKKNIFDPSVGDRSYCGSLDIRWLLYLVSKKIKNRFFIFWEFYFFSKKKILRFRSNFFFVKKKKILFQNFSLHDKIFHPRFFFQNKKKNLERHQIFFSKKKIRKKIHAQNFFFSSRCR